MLINYAMEAAKEAKTKAGQGDHKQLRQLSNTPSHVVGLWVRSGNAGAPTMN